MASAESRKPDLHKNYSPFDAMLRAPGGGFIYLFHSFICLALHPGQLIRNIQAAISTKNKPRPPQ